MAHGKGDAKKVVIAALAGNLAIAVSKFVAAYFSASTATLAEAVHSLADTGNQALLLVGMVLASRAVTDVYAFGRAAERYFWPFVVALILFTVGGIFAVYEGVHKILYPSHDSASQMWSIGVLFASMCFEGYSFSVALREFKKLKGSEGYVGAIHHAKDPTIPLVLLEDTSALVGLVIALTSVALTAITGNFVFDSIGSILIGVMLCGTATVLAIETHGLLIGESASPEVRRKLVDIAEATPGVRKVTQLLTLHIGPDEVLAALKVAFESHIEVERVEEITNDLEERVRAELPEMKRIFVEVDSHGDLRGVPAQATKPVTESQ